MSLGQQVVQQLLREVKNRQDLKILQHRRAVGDLITLLLASGMTQIEIAEQLHCGQPTVSRYLSGKLSPSKKMAEALITLAKKRNIRRKIPTLNGWAM
jgi:predicted XRE-type DNA-binding protein